MIKFAIINNFKGPVPWVNQIQFPYVIYNKYNPRIDKQYWKSEHENIYDYYKRLFQIPNYLEIMKPLDTDDPSLVTNVGHETSTFFGHIVNNFYDLADMYIFLHNTPFHHCENIMQLINNIKEPIDFIEFGTTMDSDREGGPTDTCPVGKIFHQLFPDKPIPEIFNFASGSLFGMSKSNIERLGIEFFKQCVRISEVEPLAPWAFERLFKTIFSKESI